MTAREKITLQRLSEHLDAYIEEDNKWKQDISDQIKPLLDDRGDRIIVQRYGNILIKAVAAFIGFIVLIGTGVRLFLDWNKVK